MVTRRRPGRGPLLLQARQVTSPPCHRRRALVTSVELGAWEMATVENCRDAEHTSTTIRRTRRYRSLVLVIVLFRRKRWCLRERRRSMQATTPEARRYARWLFPTLSPLPPPPYMLRTPVQRLGEDGRFRACAAARIKKRPGVHLLPLEQVK